MITVNFDLCKEFSKSEQQFITEFSALIEKYKIKPDQKSQQPLKKEVLKTLQFAYLYHCLDDNSIGDSKLGDLLLDSLCEIMGDEEYQKWIDIEAKRIRGEQYTDGMNW